MSAAETPRFSAPLFRGFVRYVRRYLGRHFESVWMSRAGAPAPRVEGPLIVFANHPSWWDPMFFYLLAGTLYPERRHFGPMDAESLRKYPVLQRLGVFGVELESRRGALQFLRQAQAALAQPGGTLWITPQGQFTDARSRPLQLKSGLGHLAARLGEVTLVPLAIELTFWNESEPAAFLRLGDPLRVADDEAPDRIGARCTAALEATMDALGAEVQRRDPAAFTPVIGGRTGVSGIYGLWRRLGAWIRLRQAQTEHDPTLRAGRDAPPPDGEPGR